MFRRDVLKGAAAALVVPFGRLWRPDRYPEGLGTLNNVPALAHSLSAGLPPVLAEIERRKRMKGDPKRISGYPRINAYEVVTATPYSVFTFDLLWEVEVTGAPETHEGLLPLLELVRGTNAAVGDVPEGRYLFSHFYSRGPFEAPSRVIYEIAERFHGNLMPTFNTMLDPSSRPRKVDLYPVVDFGRLPGTVVVAR